MTQDRIRRFQDLMKTKGVDAALIRTLSSFTYFAGVRWLRPALLIPAEGNAQAFIFKHEVEPFLEKASVKDVAPYGGIDELMRGVSESIRENKFRNVGFDFSIERDAYVLFFEMFKKLNPKIEIVDTHAMIMELRIIKEPVEIERIRRASKITDSGMDAAISAVDVGVSELEVAAEATYAMMKKGSEHPNAHVNTGAYPRKHAEPRSSVKIGKGDAVTITLAADYGDYYSNETRTHLVEGAPKEKMRALEALKHIYDIALENLRPGIFLDKIESEIGQFLKGQGYANNYVQGFAHGVGLLVEEDPITTILIPHRRQVIKENMALAAVHSPIAIPSVGAMKCEDTFLIRKEGPEQLTKYACEAKHST